MTKSLGQIATSAYIQAWNRRGRLGPPMIDDEAIEEVAIAIARHCAEVIRDRWADNITKGNDTVNLIRVHEGTQCELALLALIKEEQPA